MLLLSNTPHEMAQSPDMIDFFLSVADKAVCFAGRRGDAVESGNPCFRFDQPQIDAPPESGRRVFDEMTVLHGIVTVVVLDGALSVPDESTLVT